MRLTPYAFDPGRELTGFGEAHRSAGAIVDFCGRVRAVSARGEVTGLVLEHYPGMTEKMLAVLEREARTRWALRDALVMHRVGWLPAGEPIVWVAVASDHRAAAFAACEFLIDGIKTRAPFWKKEIGPAGAVWVSPHPQDTLRARRWGVPR